nr:MAG TPA: hypothetical protein [Caudoviricetes sp.]
MWLGLIRGQSCPSFCYRQNQYYAVLQLFLSISYRL